MSLINLPALFKKRSPEDNQQSSRDQGVPVKNDQINAREMQGGQTNTTLKLYDLISS